LSWCSSKLTFTSDITFERDFLQEIVFNIVRLMFSWLVEKGEHVMDTIGGVSSFSSLLAEWRLRKLFALRGEVRVGFAGLSSAICRLTLWRQSISWCLYDTNKIFLTAFDAWYPGYCWACRNYEQHLCPNLSSEYRSSSWISEKNL